MAQVKVRKAKITELIQDDRNLNKGTERGKELIQKSIGQFGAVRGVAVDKDNRIIAGNKTVENAIEQGVEEIIIVETTGKELVVTKRVDTSLDTKEGREMALADNATVKADLALDTEELNAVADDFGIDTDDWLSEFPQEENLPEELQGLDIDPEKLKEIEGADETPMKRILIVYKPEDEEKVAALLGVAKIDKIIYDYGKELE